MKKYKKFFKTELSEFFRDFSGFGNLLILIAIYSLVFEGNLLLLVIAGLITTLIICYLIKLILHKERPNHADFTNILEKVQSGSFPSAHSAIIMYSGLMIIKYTSSFLSDAAFAITILLVGYSRYHLKKHYIKDILGGYFIGFLIFLLIVNFLV